MICRDVGGNGDGDGGGDGAEGNRGILIFGVAGKFGFIGLF